MKKRWLAALLALALAFLSGCGALLRGAKSGLTSVADSQLFHQGRHGGLSKAEKHWAAVAWKYFEHNYQPITGLVNGGDGFPVASVWNIADTLAATIAAREFGLLDDYNFDHRVSTLLGFLNTMPLSFGKLPNRYYQTQKAEMVDAAGQPKNAGWSAVDIGRLLIWLQILHAYAPQYGEYIDKAILRWHFCEVIDDCGRLYGSSQAGDKSLFLYPDMPIGYRDYALLGYAAWGFRIDRTHEYDKEHLARIYHLDIPYSSNDPRHSGTYYPVVSQPYLLLGLEFNWDRPGDTRSGDTRHTDSLLSDIAGRLYQVQETRYLRERIFTARTGYQRNSDPYFIYDTIFAAGYAWNTITPDGQFKPELALVSNRAAFGMWALWKTRYTDALMLLLENAYHPERGWFEGRYEKSGGFERNLTCTTNAMVLEALYYKVRGKLYQVPQPRTYASLLLSDEFRRPPCFPAEREECPRPPPEEAEKPRATQRIPYKR